MWRVGRALYTYSRRDFSNTIATNGERDLQRAISRRARSRTLVVLDIGANVGDWATSMRAAAGPNLSLFAFEPAPGSYERLAAAIGPAAAIRSAIGDKVGVAAFVVGGATAGTNALATEGHGSLDVPITTVTEFARQRGLAEIDLVKSDVEGFDAAVIRGALPLLRTRSIAVLQFEYNWRWKFNRAFLSDVFDLIQDLGYALGKVVPGGVEMYPEWHPELERFIEANYALVRLDVLDAVGARPGSFDASNTYASS